MPNYLVKGTDPAGKPVQFETGDLPDQQAWSNYFSPLQDKGYKLAAKPIAAAPAPTPTGPTTSSPISSTPPSYATGMGTTAPPGMASTEYSGISPEQASLNRRRAGMMGLTTLAASIPGAIPAVAGAATAAGTAARALPYVGAIARPIVSSGIRALSAALPSAGAGALSSTFYPEGGSAGDQAITQGLTGAAGSVGGDIVGGTLKGIWNFLKNRVGVTITADQWTALSRAATEAAQENRPFSITGFVQNAPEFAGSPARQRIVRMAKLGGENLFEAAGVPQTRYAEQHVGRALTAMGGPLSPEAQGVAPGFGLDARQIINDSLSRLRQEAAVTAQSTIKRPATPTIPGLKKEAQAVIANPALSGPEAGQRLAAIREIPKANKAARQVTAREYQGMLDKESLTFYKNRLAQIKDETGIQLDKVTQQQLSDYLTGAKVDQVVALSRHVPELQPAIARAELTSAIAKSRTNPASDSFDFPKLATEIRRVGEHNLDTIYGANADQMRKFLTALDSFAEGRAVVAMRKGEQVLTSEKPQWQPIAAVLAPVARIMSGANPLGLGTALGGGGGTLFAGTTGVMTGSPAFYTYLMTNPNTLRTFTNLVDDAGRGILTERTRAQYITRVLADLGVYQGGLRRFSTPSAPQPEQDFPTLGYNPPP